MYDFFAQASSLHTNEQARAIKFYVEPSSVQINRASILELSVHCKCPVGTDSGKNSVAYEMAGRKVVAPRVKSISLPQYLVHGDGNGVTKEKCNESILICTLFQRGFH